MNSIDRGPAAAQHAADASRPLSLHMAWTFLLSFPAVHIAGLIVITVLTTSNRFADPDLWWHLKIGEVMWNTRSILRADIFSFTANGQPWMPHEWVGELILYGTYLAGGYTGLMVWLCVLLSLLLVAVYVLSWMHSHDTLFAFLGALLAWFFGTVGFAIRPLVLGNLFLAVELVLLELGRTHHKRWFWSIPPLFALWVNTHASYFLGIAVLCVYWASAYANGRWGLITATPLERPHRRALGAVLVLSLVALCCNPVGVHLLLYPLDTLFGAWFHPTAGNVIDEWMPPNLGEVRTLGMLGVAAGVLLLTLLRRRELPLREFLLVLMATGLAIRHTRLLFQFGIIVSPILFGMLPGGYRRNGHDREHPFANLALIAACLGAIVLGFPSRESIQRQIAEGTPSRAVDYIRKAGLSGPLLNEWTFGGYLMWALPQEKIFIDGRGDIYDQRGVMRAYGRWITVGEDPELLLNKYGVRLCLLPSASRMRHVLPYLPGWRQAYSDDVATIFVR